MLIKKLTLKNFRNYSDAVIEFAEKLNVLFGKNAQGKTNCAEAVFYLCTGTSLRIKKDRQLIKNGAEFAYAKAECQNRYGNITLEARIFEHKRELYVNGNKISRSADLLDNVNCVFFSPGELRLVQDGPDERRRFMNISISQNSKKYYTALSRYNKILEQRNALLKSKDFDVIFQTLPLWDKQFADYAATVIIHRAEYLKKLSAFACQNHAYLTDGAEQLEIKADGGYPADEKDVVKKLLNEFADGYEKDVRLGFTGTGPHRDDVKILINGLDARAYASQGQARTAALSIKLAESQIFSEHSGEFPILILDDVLSELDLARSKKLIEKTDGMQTIITCTHTERVISGKSYQKMRVVNGTVKAL